MFKVLLKRAHLQEVDLFLSQIAPAAAGQVFLGQSGKVDTVELGHVIAEALKDAAHDAVAARVDFDTGLIAVGVGGIGDGVGVDGAVLKLDAVGDALHIFLGDVLVAPYVIDLLLDVLRVCELRGEVAVVGEQQHAGGVAVETSDGVDALGACTLDEVHDRGAVLRILARGDAVLGLVEQDVALALQCHHLVVVFDHIVVGDLGAELGDYLAVDLDQALLDKFVGLAARAYAGVAHEFVETDLLVGIRYRHLVLDALGAGCEALAACGEESSLALLLARAALLIATLAATLLVAALLALLIASLGAALLVSALLALLVTALAALLISALLAGLVAPLATLLVRPGLVLAGLVAALGALLLLPLLVAGLIGTRLVSTLLAGLISSLAALLVGSGLIGPRLIAALAAFLAVGRLGLGIVAILAAGLIAALLTGLVGPRLIGARLALGVALGAGLGAAACIVYSFITALAALLLGSRRTDAGTLGLLLPTGLIHILHSVLGLRYS